MKGYLHMNKLISRGDLYYADLDPIIGSEQGGIRPVVVLQNNVGNKYSPTVIVTAITSRRDKSILPTHHKLYSCLKLSQDSVALLEQIRTIDKTRLMDYIGSLDGEDMTAIDTALAVSVGLGGTT